jgi:transposase-like protein
MGDGIGDFAFWLAVGLGSLGLCFGPIGRALGEWIQAHSRRLAPAPDDDPARAEDAARLEALESRLVELEERLDFTERVLAQSRQAQLDGADTPPEALPAAGTR